MTHEIITSTDTLIKTIKGFISENIDKEDFADLMYENFESGINNVMNLVSKIVGHGISTNEALGIHKKFWQLNFLYANREDVGHEPFFILVGAEEANHFPWTVSKEDLIEFDRKEGTFLYRNFRNESDDLPFSEYPIAVMMGKMIPDLHCFDKGYDQRIKKIRNMIYRKHNVYDIADEIEYCLQDILRDTSTSLYQCPTLKKGIYAAKELIEIYTNEEYELPHIHSEMIIKFINYSALMNHGRILVEWLSDEKPPYNQNVVINGVEMKAADAISFLDELIELNRTMTKRFYFNKLSEPDEEVSVHLAEAMKKFSEARNNR